MKATLTPLAATLLGLAGTAFAQTPSGMQGMQMGLGMRGTPMQKTAQGTGVIKALGTASGTVTIRHQAIASIHWPAMTMTFKADPPSLLKGVKVGEKVNFTLRTHGMHGTVVAIALVQ